MADSRYEIPLLVLKKYFTREIFSTLEEKFGISKRPCNILYVIGKKNINSKSLTHYMHVVH